MGSVIFEFYGDKHANLTIDQLIFPIDIPKKKFLYKPCPDGNKMNKKINQTDLAVLNSQVMLFHTCSN